MRSPEQPCTGIAHSHWLYSRKTCTWTCTIFSLPSCSSTRRPDAMEKPQQQWIDFAKEIFHFILATKSFCTYDLPWPPLASKPMNQFEKLRPHTVPALFQANTPQKREFTHSWTYKLVLVTPGLDVSSEIEMLIPFSPTTNRKT